MIRPGEPWGSPASSPPDLEVTGSDGALAAAVAAAPGALVRFRPDPSSDVARSVGLAAGTGDSPQGTELPLDALAFPEAGLACNMCIFGTPPDHLRWTSPALDLEVLLDERPWFTGRATTLVIASGQFLRGLDVVPRGHPGDGRAEVQIYELARRERRPMRARLATGAHVPHPRIRQRTARTITLRSRPPAPWEVDGSPGPKPVSVTTITVVPGAYRLLV